MANYEYLYDPEDDNYEPAQQEWIPLGYGIWLIRYTWLDNSAEVQWAEQRPGGGFRVHM